MKERAMQRREFNALSLSALASLSAAPALSQTAAFKEGTDYLPLKNRVATDVGKGKIEVLEFFWYNCPHCNAFEPTLSAWSKKLPKDIVLKRVPVKFREDFEPQQRAYYVLEALGKVEELQSKMFSAIHVEKQNLAKLDNLLVWAEKNGIPAAKFNELFNSPTCTTLSASLVKRGKRPNCKKNSKSKACLHWASVAATTWTAVWPAAWNALCKSPISSPLKFAKAADLG